MLTRKVVSCFAYHIMYLISEKKISNFIAMLSGAPEKCPLAFNSSVTFFISLAVLIQRLLAKDCIHVHNNTWPYHFNYWGFVYVEMLKT